MLIDDIASMIAEGLAREYEPFEAFCQKYLRHLFTKPGSVFHSDLKARLAEILVHRNQKDVWIAPRGNAKSTIISLAYILYCVCTGQERYIILVSDTHPQSKQFLDRIKAEFESNGKLARAYPGVCGKGGTWSTDSIVTRNSIKIDALGMRGKIRGRIFGAWRPTLIVVDDPENDESVISPVQRTRTLNWLLSSAVACGVPDYTNIVVIGTVINAQCLVQTLAEGQVASGWRVFKYQSVIEWPTRMDLWEEWAEVFWQDQSNNHAVSYQWYLDRQEEMDEGAVVLWPEHEPLYSLMRLRCEIGKLSFLSEKQNDPANPDQCKFGDEWTTRKGFWWDELPGDSDDWTCIGACDPSMGKDSKKGDFAALITVWFKPGHRWLYVDCEMVRLDADRLIDRILELHKAYGYHVYGFEDNGFQTVLKDILQTKSGERNVWLPVVGITHKKNKQLRIERLAPYLQSGYYRFRKGSKGCNLLIKQITMFPIADHDDGPDCLEMATNIAEKAAA